MSERQSMPASRVQSVIGRGQFLPLRLSRSTLFTDLEITRILHEGNLLQPPPRCRSHSLAAAVETPSAGVSMVRNVYDTRILVPPGASVMYFHPGMNEYLVFNPATVDRTENITTTRGDRRDMNVLEKGMEIMASIWRRMREFGKRLGHQDEIAIVEMQNNDSFTTVAVSITSTSLNPLKFAFTKFFNRWFPESWWGSRTDSMLLRFSMIVLAKS
ncbi:uncharacterized protein H6S33_009649 [Morchella sextelata]|uniref:uncharacterized protein n=1 Tax=Morchella sextelata TaxID=1174677 RepID=UPI001D03E20E|nr:uncharacterized protein H6S33_009649 [Morchella sextelata]KAH0613269.1 hypothetical protein H6S33_009649 [Morchella sextelata]